MLRIFTVLLLLTTFFTTNYAQLSPQSISIPMRDGNSLAADLYLPNTTDSFPVILIQTPYNKNFYQFTGMPIDVGYDIANSPYAFVVLDWRCYYGSVGACTLNSSQGEDGYDAVEWIAQQSWSDGQVGTWGPSALGKVQFETAKKRPPSLVCAVPQVASPHYHYHGYFPGGALLSEYISSLGVLFGAGGFTAVIDNPHYNIIWLFAEAGSMYPDSIEVPMLLVGGWYDHAIASSLEMLDTMHKQSAAAVRHQHKMLVGPWVHGGTGQAHVGSNVQGELTYPQAAEWNDSLERQFFDYYLLGMNNGYNNNGRYMYFQMGDNMWDTSAVWPPTGAQRYNFYLHDDLSIQTMAPSTNNNALSFSYDPTNPSPTVGGKTLGPSTSQGPYNQADTVENRNDVLVFTTGTLTQDLTIKGKIDVNLFVESDRKDTDIAVRLTEVYPDGRSMLVAHGIQRMRFRNGYEVSDTAMMYAGQVYPITITLDDLATTFKTGQKLRLVISSSNYPLYNRNMNTGGDMYPNSNPDTLVNPLVANNTIHLSANYPSNIELPLYNYSPPTATTIVEEKKATFEVFPNPSKGVVHIKNALIGSTLTITNALGQVVWQEAVQTSTLSVDLSRLSAGVYQFSMWHPQDRVESRMVRIGE